MIIHDHSMIIHDHSMIIHVDGRCIILRFNFDFLGLALHELLKARKIWEFLLSLALSRRRHVVLVEKHMVGAQRS